MVNIMPNTFNVFKSTVFNPAIDKALETSCVNGVNREPCYTAALAKELPRILNGIITGETKKLGIPPMYRFGSCYVHQKPYVRFGSGFKSRCELGDLLVLVKKTINGVAAFNSALFQLKNIKDTKAKIFQVRPNSSEDKQLTLYTRWGELKIDLKSENTTEYDVTPHSVSQGGLYMFVRSNRQHPKFVVAVPDRNMETTVPPSFGYYSYPVSFGHYLSRMVKWQCGRAIASKNDTKNGCADDWSRLIWRVIELLENAVSNCNGYGEVKRDNECGSFAFLTVCHEIDSIGESGNVDLSNDPDFKGFGILYIEELDDVANTQSMKL